MTIRQHPASPSALSSAPGQLLPAARALEGLVPLALARGRLLRARQAAKDAGAVLVKQPQVTSSPRSVNSEGGKASALSALSGRGPFDLREPVLAGRCDDRPAGALGTPPR